MARLVKFEIREMPAFRVIGKAVYPRMDMQENPIPAFWSRCFEDGTFKALDGMKEDSIDPSYVGFMCDWTKGDGSFAYLCGMLMKPGTPVPDGYEYRDMAASAVAVGWIQGPEKDIYPVAHEYTLKELENQGYRTDGALAWCMELYQCPRFTCPQENGEVILDYYIPCVPAKQ